MPNIRIIPRLDIKGENLIKGIHLEGLRVVGEPQVFARRYFENGADELIFMDAVASLYQRNHLADLVSSVSRGVFIPLTVGGGIRSVADARNLLSVGADKIAVNTAAIRRPALLAELAETFGSQCVVLSIEAKRTTAGKWEAMTDCGREHSGLDVLAWVRRGLELGAGEILLTSVDQEGTQRGFDLELSRAVAQISTVPVITCGGMGSIDDAMQVINAGGSDAVCAATVFHYNKVKLSDLEKKLHNENLRRRRIAA